MELLIIGKIPPIEGGVSAQTFWLARALSRQGHAVHVVTNASSVEPSFRQLLYGRDREILLGTLDAHGIDVQATTPLTPHSYIPYAPPYVTQLFGLSHLVMARHRCEAIFGWYLEPYGFVAALMGNTTGVPVFIRHSGSDLARLSANCDLHEAYRWALGSATGLMVTNEAEFERRYGGVSRRRLRLRRTRLPEEFSAGDDMLQIAEVVLHAEDWFGLLGLADELVLAVHALNRKPFVEETFTIGTYGKVGETKGSYDLIEALASLADIGAKFNFLTMASGTRSELDRYYGTILRNQCLTERSWILPPLAPWRIPSFLRRCQAVCFLERDFLIQFHGPLIPREVLSSGACLVCSREVAEKREYGHALVDRRNAVIIEDPRDNDVALVSTPGAHHEPRSVVVTRKTGETAVQILGRRTLLSRDVGAASDRADTGA